VLAWLGLSHASSNAVATLEGIDAFDERVAAEDTVQRLTGPRWHAKDCGLMQAPGIECTCEPQEWK
jgi:hypothetical protein